MMFGKPRKKMPNNLIFLISNNSEGNKWQFSDIRQ